MKILTKILMKILKDRWRSLKDFHQGCPVRRFWRGAERQRTCITTPSSTRHEKCDQMYDNHHFVRTNDLLGSCCTGLKLFNSSRFVWELPFAIKQRRKWEHGKQVIWTDSKLNELNTHVRQWARWQNKNWALHKRDLKHPVHFNPDPQLCVSKNFPLISFLSQQKTTLLSLSCTCKLWIFVYSPFDLLPEHEVCEN